jgi:hypothetical protein
MRVANNPSLATISSALPSLPEPRLQKRSIQSSIVERPAFWSALDARRSTLHRPTAAAG